MASYHIVPTIWHLGKGMATVRRPVVSISWGLGKEWTAQEHRGFVGQGKTLYDTAVVNICHYTIVQTHEEYQY